MVLEICSDKNGQNASGWPEKSRHFNLGLSGSMSGKLYLYRPDQGEMQKSPHWMYIDRVFWTRIDHYYCTLERNHAIEASREHVTPTYTMFVDFFVN